MDCTNKSNESKCIRNEIDVAINIVGNVMRKVILSMNEDISVEEDLRNDR